MIKITLICVPSFLRINEIERKIRESFPAGTCLNFFKIERMVNIKNHVVNLRGLSDCRTLILLTAINEFMALRYEPIFLVGEFSDYDISTIKEGFPEWCVRVVRLFCRDSKISKKMVNNIKYKELITKEPANPTKRLELGMRNAQSMLFNDYLADDKFGDEFSFDISVISLESALQTSFYL